MAEVIKFTVLDKPVLERIRRIGGLADDIIKEMKLTGFAIERDAKKTVHVVTGRLRSSINTLIRGKGGDTSVTVGSNVVYAAREEFLGPGMAHAYFRPAIVRQSRRFVAKVNELLRQRTGQ